MDLNELKKLINQEFEKTRQKSLVKEQESSSTKFDDAVAVLKFFMESGGNPGSPEAQIISSLENAVNFAQYYLKSSGLSTGSPQEIAIAQRKIADKFVQQQIQSILSKMGFEPSKISGFMNYINQTVPAPEEVAKADANLAAKEEQPFEISDEDISPLNPTKLKTTVAGRVKKK